ncbi:MAG: hypothetical protein QXV73_05330 [Candidatus Micrarchaeia archaeon]
MKFRDNPIDQVYIWRNTKNEDDLRYIDSLESDYFKIFDITKEGEMFEEPKQYNTGKYYRYTTDPNTIYVRFDDDIVYVDDDYFKNILDFRLNNPQYFLVMGNIWNNAIISYIQQRMGRIDWRIGVVEKEHCMDRVGWASPQFANGLHRILKEKIEQTRVSDLFFDRWELHNAQRFSISNFCFFGKDFLEFGGILKFDNPHDKLDEEIWLTEYYPRKKRLLNVVCGTALVCHFSFFYQREYLMQKGWLEYYRELSEKKLSESYYNFVEK